MRVRHGIGTAGKLVIHVIGIAFFCLAGINQAAAGAPEYMKLKARVGQALEIKGYMNDDNSFVATDIEELPKPRQPKLRGEIEAIDVKNGTVRLFGMTIEVADKTEFVDGGGDKQAIEHLSVGQRVEVSAKVDEDGHWIARKIKAHGVKDSDKIKGTITGLSVDGTPPDTLDISGLIILLDLKTDVDDADEIGQAIEDDLLGDLALTSARGYGHGRLLGDNVVIAAQYRHEFRSQNEYDLSLKFDSDRDDTQQDVRLEALGFWGEKVRVMAQLRFRKRYLIASDQNLDSEPGLLRFTQLYALVKDAGVPGLVIQLGRQDFDEPREWLWDEYLDALRVYYYGQASLVFEAAYIKPVEPIKLKFETWTDRFAGVRWYYDKDNVISAFWLARRDSDEVRNREPVWYGFRYHGEIKKMVRPWFNCVLMRGEDKYKKQDAWALDVGATITGRRLPLVPALTLAYAVGSGDEVSGDNVSQQFRQTAYQDNVERLGGVSSVHYYGLVLDPELSNIKIQTVGVAVRPVVEGSLELIYHSYRQHQLDADLKGSNLIDPPARPNGDALDLGWGFDFVVAPPLFFQRLRATFTLGFFSPGEAFAPRLEDALLGKLDLMIEL